MFHKIFMEQLWNRLWNRLFCLFIAFYCNVVPLFHKKRLKLLPDRKWRTRIPVRPKYIENFGTFGTAGVFCPEK